MNRTYEDGFRDGLKAGWANAALWLDQNDEPRAATKMVAKLRKTKKVLLRVIRGEKDGEKHE